MKREFQRESDGVYLIQQQDIFESLPLNHHRFLRIRCVYAIRNNKNALHLRLRLTILLNIISFNTI